MSKTEEDKKREEQQQNTALKEKAELERRQADQAKEDASKNAVPKNDDSKAKYQLDDPNNENWKKMLKDYNEKKPPYPDSPAKEEDHTLTFNNKEEAIVFFKDQADKGRAFDMRCTEFDHRVYSDGKGTFVQGKIADVEAYLKDPKAYDVKEDGSFKKIGELKAGANSSMGPPASSNSVEKTMANLPNIETTPQNKPESKDVSTDLVNKNTTALETGM